MLIKDNYKLREFYDPDVEIMRGAASLELQVCVPFKRNKIATLDSL